MSDLNYDLATLQSQFQAFLMQADPALSASIRSTPSFPVEARLAVYSDAYCLRLVGILEKEFPRLRQYCGEEAFDEATFRYLDQYPSQHYSLYRFSKDFSVFLSRYFIKDPVVAELAAFEKALGDVLLAGNGLRIDSQAVLNVLPEKWPGLRFIVHPATIFLPLSWDIPRLWGALLANQAPPLALARAPSNYLIWRFHQQSYFKALTPEQAQIFSGIQAGLCFAEICEGLIPHFKLEEIGGYVASVLQEWIQSGLFIGVVVD